MFPNARSPSSSMAKSTYHKPSSIAHKTPHHRNKRTPLPEANEWENALCSVCMEFPHHAVLLLCCSHDKGCRPYMCATGRRHSNCLKQYKKACNSGDVGPSISPELSCPLCRGAVKGWTVVGPARRHLDAKRRSCINDGCPFRGNYRELRRHAKTEHPLARPRDVDPGRAARWEILERERALDDVLSTIRSTMPGAVVVGDYVIERDSYRGEFYEGNGSSGRGPWYRGARVGATRYQLGRFRASSMA